MNARSIVLIFAVALIGVGLLLTLKDLFGDKPPPTQVVIARANQQIEPSTVVSQDMISTESMSSKDAEAVGAWKYNQVAGMMAGAIISPGEILTAANVQPLDEYRGDSVLDEELVSFSASVDRMVAGQLKPGQMINVYGTKTGRPEDTFTVLIEPNVRIVRVQQSGGQSAGAGTPQANWETGQVTYGADSDPKTGTLLVVALPPEKAFHLIDSLGAKGLQPWVTVAGNNTVMALATPQAGQPEPIDISATMTAIALALQAQTPVPPPATGGGGASR